MSRNKGEKIIISIIILTQECEREIKPVAYNSSGSRERAKLTQKALVDLQIDDN